jgi:hypothetical protein
MTQFVIEKNIPPPQKSAKYGLVATLCRLDIGDSVFAPTQRPQSIQTSKNNAQKKSGFLFSTRSVDGGVRVWRIE